jgi:GNAT superfamily N-acetyltransferase
MLMQNRQTEIIEFQEHFQEAVEKLVLPIQQLEFGVAISRDEQLDLIDVKGVFQDGGGNFWLAIRDSQVVGTVGVVAIGNNQVALKKMFVRRDCRGKEQGISIALLNHAKDWCKQQGIRQIFLGSTTPMVAAHKFYEKNDFVLVEIALLPSAFPIVPVDSVFYRCDLQ